MNLNKDFNGKTFLKDWWKIIKTNMNTIETEFNGEAGIRNEADTSLNNRINAELSARKNSDSVLQSNINNEASKRKELAVTLNQSINNEVDERKQADTDLKNQINMAAQRNNDRIKQILGTMILSCNIQGGNYTHGITPNVSSSGYPSISLNGNFENQFFIGGGAVTMQSIRNDGKNLSNINVVTNSDGSRSASYAIYFKWNYVNNTLVFNSSPDLSFQDYVEDNTWYHTVCIINQECRISGATNEWDTSFDVNNNLNTTIEALCRLHDLATEDKDSLFNAVNENAEKIKDLQSIPIITVDENLSLDSENPVQNKAIQSALDDMNTLILNNRIVSVEQTTESDEDKGVNVVTMTMGDNRTAQFTVKNGSKGSKGDIGNLWYTGTDMSGTGTEQNIYYYADCPQVREGDMYLNTTTGSVYKCTAAGNGNDAKWTYQLCIKGADCTKYQTDTIISNWSERPLQSRTIMEILIRLSLYFEALSKSSEVEICNTTVNQEKYIIFSDDILDVYCIRAKDLPQNSVMGQMTLYSSDMVETDGNISGIQDFQDAFTGKWYRRNVSISGSEATYGGWSSLT